MTLEERFKKQNNDDGKERESTGLSLNERFGKDESSSVDYAKDYLSKAADSEKLAKYASVMKNADFAEKSQYYDGGAYSFTNQTALNAYRQLNDTTGKYNKGKDDRNISLTPNEKAVFNYLYNTGDKKAATELYLDLIDDSSRRYNEIQKAAAEKRIDNYGSLAAESVASVLANVMGGLGQVIGGTSQGITSALLGEGFSKGWVEAANQNRLSNYSNAVREASTNKIAQDTGNEIAPFLYQTGMSVADSMLSALVAGGVGETASLVALGGSAAQQKTMEVLANGGTAQEAAASGIASGIIEGLTEKIPLDNLTKILKGEVKGGFRELAKVVARNMLSEGGEEVASEMANALADAIILDWANENGAESDYSKLYQEEIANGATEQEAALAMLGEYAKNIGVSFAGGALGAMFSGGIFGGVRMANDASIGKQTIKNERTQDIADLARKEGREDIAQMIENRPTNLNVGYAQDALAQEAIEKINDKNATDEEIIAKLNLLGDMKNAQTSKTGLTDKNGNVLHLESIRWVDGKPVYVTNEGVYKAADVKVTDSASKLVNLTEDIPESMRTVFMDNYNGENLGDYVNKFEKAYELSLIDHQEDLKKMVTDGLLTEEQMTNIWKAAQKEETSETYKLELLNKNIEEKKRLIPDKKLRVKIDTSRVDVSKLNDNQKHNVNLVSALARALGFNFTLYDSTKETGEMKYANGKYDRSTNSIWVDVNATNTRTKNKSTINAIVTTASHELTHWAKTNAPSYKNYKEAVLHALIKSTGQDLTIGEYVELNRINYKGLSDAEIEDELVARASENMLQNSAFAKSALVKMTQENRQNIGKKILEFFNKIRLALKEIMGRHDSNAIEYRMLAKDMDTLNELQKMWDDLIKEASSNAAWLNEDIAEGIESGVLLDGSEENSFLFSQKTYDEGGREFLQKWLNKQKDLTKNEKAAILDSMEQIYETVEKLKDGYQSYSNWAEAGAELRGDDGEISVVVNNGDYALNIDFATVCKKREVLNKVLNELVKSGDLNIYTLTGTDINRINQIIKENGFEIACALCFVDAKRYRVAEWARSFEDTFNDVIYQFAGANGKTADEFNYTGRSLDNPTEALISDADDVNLAVLDKIIKDNTGDTGSLNAKGTIAKAIKENRRLWHKINAAEILSSAGLDEIRRKNKALYKLVNGWEGSAKPKLSHEKIPYVNDILKSGKFNPKAAFKVGGVRIQSFSDFVPTMIFDYVQMVSELQAKGLPAHAYTKELTFAKLFGLTGIKINLSAIAKGKPIKNEWYDSKGNIKKEYRDLYARANAYVGLKTNEEGFPVDADGNVITTNYNMTDEELLRAVYETDDESIDLEEAMKLQNTPGYDKNVGIIFVGASNNAIRKMLDDPNIPMVIPYHKSGINPVVAHLRNIASYTDYTDVQNTMFADGKKIDRSKLKNDAEKAYYDSLNWYTLLEKNKNNAKKAASEYIKLCEKKGWKPKFYEFKDNPNYYKLLEDFRMYDSNGIAAPQQVVKLTNGLDKNGKAIINMPSNEEFIKALEGDEKTGGLKKYDKHISELENGKLKKITDQIRKELKEAQYSLKEDSEGKELTEDQAEFFKNSVVKDAEGRLIRVYHGTKNGGFTVFNKADDGISYFFTDNKEVAESYSGVSMLQNPDTPMSFEELERAFEFFDNEIEETKDGFLITDSDGEEHAVKTLKEAQAWLVDNNISIASAQGLGEASNYEVYLNIQNPLVVDAQGENWNTVNFEPEDTELAERMHPVYSRLLELWKKEKEGSLTKAEIKELEEVEEKYSELENESNRKFKVYETTRDVARYAYENGYDGVIFNNIVDNGGYSLSDASSTVYVVFNSNQIKSIYNEHPTGDSDIRYSIKDTVVDVNGKVYHDVLDVSDKVTKTKANNPQKLKELILGLAEHHMTLLGMDDVPEEVYFARTSDKAPKGKKEPSKVLNELIYSNGDTRRATIVHIEDALKASVWYDEYYKNEHGWLDEKGWEKRKLFVLDNGTIYPVYLSIGKARDGRRILYSANLVAKEGVRTEKDSPKGKLIGNLTPSQRSVAPKADKVNKEKINTNTAAEKEDSLGRKLSEGQISYFNRSVVRNKIGQLLRMYHGTWENFTVFKTNEFSKELSGLSKIKGYFSEDKSFSESYGEVKEFYLNITNPLDMGDGEARTLHEWKLWFKNHGINGVLFDDALLDDSLIGATFEGKRYYVPFEIVDPLSPYRKGNGNVTEMIQKAGYDGIKWGYDEAAWMPFSEEQIKSVDNLNPTEDPDVMFSWKDNDGYLHLDTDDVLSMDDFEDYLNRVIGKNKRIEAHLRRLNVEIKDNVILNNTKLYQFAKTIKENYASNETIKSIAEELAKAYRKVTDIEAFDKAAESVAKKYATDEEAVKALYSDIREASWRISDNLTMAEKYNEAMKELRERLKNVKEEVREEAQRKRLIQKIVEREDKLITMLRKNDKENHIPDVLKAPLKTLLELVNVESYISTEAMANNFNALANALQNVSADYSDPASMDEALKDLTLYFDSNSYFVQNVKDIAAEVQESVNKAMNVRKGASVLDLSLESLKKLNEALVAISHAAWNYDRVLAEDTTQRISDRSESTMNFVGSLSNRSAFNDVVKKAISFFAWDNTTPVYGYDRFGEGGKDTFKGIMIGDDQLTLNSKTIIEFAKGSFTGQEAEDWTRELHDLGIKDYKITTAQIMSLYCLNKRQAAKQHLYAAKDLYGKHMEGAVKNVYGEVIDGQGIVNGASKGIEKSVPIKVTKADVERITSMLTERQKQVADALQEFMSTTCADWGNYVTMRRFGIMQFGEKDYFPMQVFRENSPSLPQEIPQQASIFKLLNMGFTKSLNERGNGALELNSIFDVFIKHSSEMAAYNAFALPILDAYKWMSYKTDTADGLKSIKTVSRLAYGDDGIKFIVNHLEDLNGTSNSATSAEQIAKNLIRRYKTAATAANMRVVLMQPTSYLRAVNEINIKYLSKAMTLSPKVLKETINEMNEKCPLAMKKNGLGAFDVNISRTVAEQALQTEKVSGVKGAFEKAMNISMIAASKADEITWATLYRAVQLETKEKFPGLTGEAFDSEVNDRFRDICYRTQVFDSINARSNLMRKKDLFHQILTAFGSEPTLSYSMLTNNIFMYAVTARNGQYQIAWNRYGKKIKHAFVAYMLSAIAVSAVAAVPDWLRDDEDDENFIQTYFKNFGMNILGEVTGLLPWIRDISSIAIEGYDPSRPDEEILKTLGQTGKAVTKAIESGDITYRTVYQAAKLFSQSTGLPIANVIRDFKAMWNKTVGEIFGMKIK